MPRPKMDIRGTHILGHELLELLEPSLDLSHQHIALGLSQVDLGNLVLLVLFDSLLQLAHSLLVFACLSIDQAV